MVDLWLNLGLLAAGLFLVFAICTAPQKCFRIFAKIAGNAAVGMLFVFVLNIFSGLTDILLPYNALTLGVSAVMGVPGIAALAALAAL